MEAGLENLEPGYENVEPGLETFATDGTGKMARLTEADVFTNLLSFFVEILK